MKERAAIDVPRNLEQMLNPGHTALLVVDLQNDNASPRGYLGRRQVDISSTRQIVPRVQAVLAEARRLGVLIVFMRRTRSADGSLESAARRRLLGREGHIDAASEYEREGTWGNEVLDELDPRAGERQIIKYFSSSFFGTPLDSLLKNQGIRCAVVVGQSTEACVESTVRDVEQYGYCPVVLRDCVTTRRPHLHDAALLVMAERYDVIEASELLTVWRRIPPT